MPFRIALSGLNAAQADLAVTGNNIANASTTGFKNSRAEFADVYAVAYGGISSTTPGSGVRLASITQQFSQGNTDYTDNNLDLSVNGQGFFVVEDNNGRAFTRAGEFHLDRDGYVTNNRDQRLQVFPPLGTNTTLFDTGTLQDIRVSTQTGAPSATNLVEGQFNFDSQAVPIEVTVANGGSTDNITTPFDPADPTTYNNSTSLAIYDSQGGGHSATIYARKVDTYSGSPPVPDEAINNRWQMFLYVDGAEVPPAGGVAGQPTVAEFTTSGALGSILSPTADPAVMQYQPLAVAGADPLVLGFDLAGSTQFGTDFSINDLSQNGFTTGRLSGLEIDDTGVIFSRFTNGQSAVLGKVAMATVSNPQGLSQLGNTSWGETFGSGDVIYGEAQTSNFGSITSGALEASNVDIAEQLVNLITAQRNFQANAQVITTADTVTQTIINIR